MKKIVIKSCEECPHKGHGGAFGHISYTPFCRKADKEIPWTASAPSLSGRLITASISGGIPEWCPLEDNNHG